MKKVKISLRKLIENKKIFVILFIAIIGFIAILVAKAGTYSIEIEAEKGADSKLVIADSSASGGKAIKFGQASQSSWWKPAQNTRWQWVLEGGITVDAANLNRFDMWDIDLTDAIPGNTTQTVTWANGETRTVTWPKGKNADAFTALKSSGKKVICYMDIGAYETYEPDASLFPGKWGSGNNSRGSIPYNGPASYANVDVIGGTSEDSAGGTFEGEYWMDIKENSWQYWAPIMWARLDVAKKIGCDGVEGDQINSYGNDKTFNITEAHSLRLYREYYYQAHQRGLTAISKNGVELTDQQVTEPTGIVYCKPGLCVPDGILNEECQQYGECDDLNPATNKGLWVGQVEYRGNATGACPDAKSKGRMAMKKPENYAVTEKILWACWEQ
ncbi:MAG: endo alpha-1,4 polygalactosaminidase [Candidatus Nomurabacteria bacterium]|nr:MAG: endo alpha-1,4 polygalactosaminidase [Candidatus Nomurabacteria bacterium]